MADYATVAEIKAFAAQDSAASLDSDATLGANGAWQILATAASRLFDNQCEVEDNFFQQADTEEFEERSFYGNNTAYLKLPPFTSLDTESPVTIFESAYDVPEYEIIGYQLVVLEKTKAQNYNETVSENRFAGWRDGVKVLISAKWGFESIPIDIKFAVIQIALAMWKNADPSFASIANADGALQQVSIPATARAVIDKYRAKYSQKALFA